MKYFIAVILALIASSVSAAEKKIPIYVGAATDDIVGTTYAYQLREQLRASQTYDLVVRQADSIFVIGLVTIDPQKTLNEGIQTTVAAGITLAINNGDGYDYLVHQWVVSVGKLKVAGSVSDIVAAIDKDVQAIILAWSKK
jgi:hypothetical protein